jgi:hypothetical protein
VADSAGPSDLDKEFGHRLADGLTMRVTIVAAIGLLAIVAAAQALNFWTWP